MGTTLVEIHCPVCDHDRYRVIHENTLGDSLPDLGYKFTPNHLKVYRIVKCISCGHMYCSPLPKQLFEQYVDVEDIEYLKNEAQRLATAEKVVDILQKCKKTGRLLDVGCSTGDFSESRDDTMTLKGSNYPSGPLTLQNNGGSRFVNAVSRRWNPRTRTTWSLFGA